jgi:hypothetical protein
LDSTNFAPNNRRPVIIKVSNDPGQLSLEFLWQSNGRLARPSASALNGNWLDGFVIVEERIDDVPQATLILLALKPDSALRKQQLQFSAWSSACRMSITSTRWAMRHPVLLANERSIFAGIRSFGQCLEICL